MRLLGLIYIFRILHDHSHYLFPFQSSLGPEKQKKSGNNRNTDAFDGIELKKSTNNKQTMLVLQREVSINLGVYDNQNQKIGRYIAFIIFLVMESIIDCIRSTFLATPTLTAFTAYIIYYLYICLGSLLLPSVKVKGHPQPKRGPQLQYDINGFRLTVLTIVIVVAFGGMLPQLNPIKLFEISLLAKEFWPLWSAVNIVAILVSIFLYLKGKFGISLLGEEVDRHSHGSFGLDFWVGRELNPRIGSFDIKFIAYRVAMIFWLVLNLSFMACQIQKHGDVTSRMWAYQISTGIYILDYFWNEPKMLTTWDIISEEFGHMLVFGDYVFIPFVFSIQCHYLIDYPDYSSILFAVPIVFLYLIGYYIFRTSNSQKNQFKLDPSKDIWEKKPETIGGKLLVSGFWGKGRHMNYTGDLIMAIAYCLPCGCQLGGYFYAFYLFTLLTHRAFRDDTKCRLKYKDLWQEYTAKVPHVFLPFQPIDVVLRGMGRGLYMLTNKEDMKALEQKKE